MWTPWGPLGDPLGTPWDPLQTSWGLLGPLPGLLGDSWEPFEDLWESLGYPLGIFGDVLAFLGEPLTTFSGSLGSSFEYFRCLLGRFVGQLEPPKTCHRPPKGPRETTWGHLGSILGAWKAFAKRFAAICKNLQIYCKVLQNRGRGRLKALKINRDILKTREKNIKIVS